MDVCWNPKTEADFKNMMAKVPIFLRPIAQEKVSKKAVSLAEKAGRREVSEKDMIDAFFAETPFGFHGPLKTDMKDLGINYEQYGY